MNTDRFEFATANRIIFGPGILQEATPEIASVGKRLLLVLGTPAELAQPLRDQLDRLGVKISTFVVTGEPTIQTVSDGIAVARSMKVEGVIGFGGGSAIDTGKAIAVLLNNPDDILDYLEVVGAGRALEKPSLPCIAIPTTAGTGSEVTRNAVLTAPGQRVKVSLRSPFMLPRIAIIDPELTYSLPQVITAITGMDALAQCIEPFVSSSASPLTDAICQEGIRCAARSLERVYRNGMDKEARLDMCLASLCGGLALANAKLGAVHGLAGAIGGRFPNAPHGAICARLLPFVVEANFRAIKMRGSCEMLEKYSRLACLVIGKGCGEIEGLCNWLHAVCKNLGIPPLSIYNLTSPDFPVLIQQAQKSSSMKGNPLPLPDEEVLQILEQASDNDI